MFEYLWRKKKMREHLLYPARCIHIFRYVNNFLFVLFCSSLALAICRLHLSVLLFWTMKAILCSAKAKYNALWSFRAIPLLIISEYYCTFPTEFYRYNCRPMKWRNKTGRSMWHHTHKNKNKLEAKSLANSWCVHSYVCHLHLINHKIITQHPKLLK